MLLPLLIALLMGLLVVLMLIRHSRSSLPGIPSPKGWPLVGHIFQMDTEKPHLQFQVWSKQCGGIYSLRLFSEEVVVLSSLDTLYEALVTKGKDFAGRPQSYYRLSLVSEGFRDLLSANPGPVWSYARKTVHKELKLYDKGKERFEAITGDVLEDLIQDINMHKGYAFDPKLIIHKAVLNVMAVLLVGKKYKPEDEVFKLLVYVDRLVRSTLTVGGSGALLDTFPWLRYLGNKTYREILETVSISKKLYANIKTQVLDDFAVGDYSAGISHIIMKNYQDQLVEGSALLDETRVKNLISNLFVGGTTTTVNTLTAFFNFMVHYPKVQKHIRQEVLRVVGTEKKPRLDDRQSMPYTRAAILELLRITTILPMAVPHTALSDSTIAGYAIPKGTQVFFNLWALHHDTDFWGDPNVFRPERYLDNSTGDLLPPDHPVRKHTLAFGSGPRVCLGETVANSRLFLFITTLIQNFHIETDHTKPLVSCDPESLKIGIVLSSPPFTVRMVPASMC